MSDVHSRKRSFDINKLSPEDADRLSNEIGAKVREICDAACTEANKILNIYGMKALMEIAIAPLEDANPKLTQEQPKKKRGRPRKGTQSLS